MVPGLEFHHFGLAVAHPEKARRFLEDLGYALGEALHDPHQRVHVALCTHPRMPSVELIWKDGGPGPLDAVLSGRTETIYHLCYTVRDREAALDTLEQAGHRLLPVAPAAPAVLFGGRRVSFHQVAGFGLVELLDP